MKVDKETFVKILKRLQEISEFEDEAAELGREHQVYVQVDGLGTFDYVVDLLDISFTPDSYKQPIDDVSYFIYETDFGKKILEKQAEGDSWVIKEDGKDISDCFTSIENLYDYLISLE